MDTIKTSASHQVNMIWPPPSKPARILPKGEKGRQELYKASFIISWKSLLFFAFAILTLMVMLHLFV